MFEKKKFGDFVYFPSIPHHCRLIQNRKNDQNGVNKYFKSQFYTEVSCQKSLENRQNRENIFP